jgi:hypothetical protein
MSAMKPKEKRGIRKGEVVIEGHTALGGLILVPLLFFLGGYIIYKALIEEK